MTDDYLKKPDLEKYNPTGGFFDLKTVPFNVYDHIQYICEGGSHAYGTNDESSDLDLRGIIIEPLNLALGMNQFEQVESKELNISGKNDDICYYSLRKFCVLLYKGGPHAMEMAHCDAKSIRYISPLMEKFLSYKDQFLSKQLHYSLVKYSLTQLITMRVKKQNGTGRIKHNNEWDYDYKMSAHSIRLFRMCREVTLTGKLNVLRPDAEELKDIKKGKFSYDNFCVWDESIQNKPKLIGGFAYDELKKTEEAMQYSILPEHPDFDFIDNLLVETLREHYLIQDSTRITLKRS